MTPLDVTLTPAQWEHYDRHGWTLVVEPTTECRNPLHGLRSAPVSEWHCPECGRAPYRSKDGDWYCFDPKRESTCRWRGPNPKVTPCCAPVPATVPCPECGGMGDMAAADEPAPIPCHRCDGSGVVPRVVGIVQPEDFDVFTADDGYPAIRYIPAERVGTATVTAVPVVDERGWLHDEDTPPEALVVELDDSLVLVSHRHQHDVTALFATPPEPGGTVWRLDKENQ